MRARKKKEGIQQSEMEKGKVYVVTESSFYDIGMLVIRYDDSCVSIGSLKHTSNISTDHYECLLEEFSPTIHELIF